MRCFYIQELGDVFFSIQELIKSLFSFLSREMSRIQLMALGETSASCEQHFRYTCQSSPIL